MQASLSVSEAARQTASLSKASHDAAEGIELIHRIANADANAMQALYIYHNVRVFRFLQRLVRDRSLAEDLTSEVFLEVWRQAKNFKGRSTVSTWLLAIARYKAFKELKRRRTDGSNNTIVETNGAAATAYESEQKCIRNAVLRKCLANLSIKHREIIDLVYYQEKSVNEVAIILGIPGSTVKTRMFYARERLFDVLTDAKPEWPR